MMIGTFTAARRRGQSRLRRVLVVSVGEPRDKWRRLAAHADVYAALRTTPPAGHMSAGIVATAVTDATISSGLLDQRPGSRLLDMRGPRQPLPDSLLSWA